MVVSYEVLTNKYEEKYHNEQLRNNGLLDTPLLVAMQTQNEVNKAVLELLENILASSYPGATRYRSS